MASVLVTGGAGFIGSHLVASLVESGHAVRVVDVRHPFAHLDGRLPKVPGAEYLFTNIGDSRTLSVALEGAEVVFHLAAALGMNASSEFPAGFVRYNTLATAEMLGFLGDHPHAVRRLVVASSNTVYGEGPYRCGPCDRTVYPPHRDLARLRDHLWEQVCPTCGSEVTPLPTPEDKPLAPTSVYAITKRDQEELCLVLGRRQGLPVIALRFFNVYGPGQSLFNPYAGVCALFESRIRRGQSPRIFEDGEQSRDLVSVHDVVRALRLAGESRLPGWHSFNVGSGRKAAISEVAVELSKLHGSAASLAPTQEFREFDIRHSYADLHKVHEGLGYSPKVTLEEGLSELVASRRSGPAG